MHTMKVSPGDPQMISGTLVAGADLLDGLPYEVSLSSPTACRVAV